MSRATKKELAAMAAQSDADRKRLLGASAGSAREWESRATEYFQLNAPHGACATCEWLRPEDPPTAEKSHWCVLVEGTCRDQDCHLCPGVNPPNSVLSNPKPDSRNASALDKKT